MLRFYLILNKKSILTWLGSCMLFVVFASPVHAKIPTDPNYNQQQDMYNQISAPQAWDYTTGSADVVVAVIDVGVDVSNKDLQAAIWRNIDEVPNNGVDDDHNGYIDDVQGWNFVEDNNDISISAIQDSDDWGAINHGTILAGLIGAAGDNNSMGAGLNWQLAIMPIRAISNDGGGVLENITRAVNYAVDNGADIISISFVGFTTYPDLTAALYNAYKKGVLVVAAAGNSRNDASGNENLTKVKQYPICLDWDYVDNWILGVTSVDEQDQLSDFADYGTCVDLSAPGEKIFSTLKFAPENGLVKNFGGPWYGTSFSAPLVAGSVALVKSIRPDWQAKELRDVLLRSADDIDNLNPGFAGQMGYGRLNVGRAVQIALESKNMPIPPPKPPVVYTTKLVTKIVKKQKIYSVQVLADGKTLRDFAVPNYSSVLSKWVVSGDLFIYGRLEKNKITVQVWDLAGNKKLNNFVLPGFNGLTKITIEQLWGDSPNAVLWVKKQNLNRKIIIDIPSGSWKTE